MALLFVVLGLLCCLGLPLATAVVPLPCCSSRLLLLLSLVHLLALPLLLVLLLLLLSGLLLLSSLLQLLLSRIFSLDADEVRLLALDCCCCCCICVPAAAGTGSNWLPVRPNSKPHARLGFATACSASMAPAEELALQLSCLPPAGVPAAALYPAPARKRQLLLLFSFASVESTCPAELPGVLKDRSTALLLLLPVLLLLLLVLVKLLSVGLCSAVAWLVCLLL